MFVSMATSWPFYVCAVCLRAFQLVCLSLRAEEKSWPFTHTPAAQSDSACSLHSCSGTMQFAHDDDGLVSESVFNALADLVEDM